MRLKIKKMGVSGLLCAAVLLMTGTTASAQELWRNHILCENDEVKQEIDAAIAKLKDEKRKKEEMEEMMERARQELVRQLEEERRLDAETEEEEEKEDVLLEENMLIATVDGEEMIFYFSGTTTASDGYELRFISFTEEGEAQNRIYLRIPLNSKAGTYSSASGFAKGCYFSLSTRYQSDTKLWGDSYNMVHYDSSSSKDDIGTYKITLDDEPGSGGPDEVTGSFEAELEGSGSNTKGKTIEITDAEFWYVKDEVHPVVEEWKNGGVVSSVSGWRDPHPSPKDNADKPLTCPSCGGTGQCSICGGDGLRVNKRLNKVFDCDVCYRTGKCQGCNGIGTVR